MRLRLSQGEKWEFRGSMGECNIITMIKSAEMKLLHVELVNRVGQLDEFTTEPLKRSPVLRFLLF